MWREAVRERGWSVARLDMKFQKKKTDIVEERDRIFERIYKRGSTPPDELVARVDKHRRFRGTARILRCPFRKLLAKEVSPDELHEIIAYEATRFGVTVGYGFSARLYLNDVEEKLAATHKIPVKRINEDVLVQRIALKTLKPFDVDLDMLALVGALCRAARYGRNSDAFHTYGVVLVRLLDVYCSKPWMGKLGNRFRKLAIKRVLHSRPTSYATRWDLPRPLYQAVLLLRQDDRRWLGCNACLP